MDTSYFGSCPVEIRQDILERLSQLRDLQSAVVSSRSLFEAYHASRRLIRQRVFCNEIFDSARTDSQPGCCMFDRAHKRIGILEENDANDGLILREALWAYLASHGQHTGCNKDVLVSAWSLRLAAAYRNSRDNSAAGAVEMQTLSLLQPRERLVFSSEVFFSWLHETVSACCRHQAQVHGVVLLDKAWKYLETADHKTVCEFSKGISLLGGHCSGAATDASVALIDATWQALQSILSNERHSNGVFCFYCIDAAKHLVTASSRLTDGEQSYAWFEMAWKQVPPRGTAFASWAQLLLDTPGLLPCRLDRALKVWDRLYAVPDPALLESYDLEWAREVILELRAQKGSLRKSIAFQSSVFALLQPPNPQYYAFGRNLADAYLAVGDISGSIVVREQVWKELRETSGLYRSWALALMRLYRKVGREEDARLLELRITHGGCKTIALEA